MQFGSVAIASPKLALAFLLVSTSCADFDADRLESAPARAMLEERDESFSGITYIHRWGQDAEGIFQNYHIAVVDLTDPRVAVRVTNNSGQWGGAKETVSAMTDRVGATLAVNGDYWSGGAFDPPQGTTAAHGFCYRAHPERSALALSADKSRAEIGQFGTWPVADAPPDDCPSWISEAVGAGPQFIFDGVARWEEAPHATSPHVNINEDTFFGSEAWDWGTTRQPNTAVGLSGDSTTLILITCDGRNVGGAGGCRILGDLTGLMNEFGGQNALKLDSGGSTTFYYDGAVRNMPSDGAERPVVNALTISSERR